MTKLLLLLLLTLLSQKQCNSFTSTTSIHFSRIDNSASSLKNINNNKVVQKTTTTTAILRKCHNHKVWKLSSSYSDFDEDDEDDDDEYDDDLDVASFRSRMESLMGDSTDSSNKDDDDDDDDVDDDGITGNEEETSKSFSSIDDLLSFVSSSSTTTSETTKSSEKEEATTYAKETKEIKAGCVLIANPYKFCNDFGKSGNSSSNTIENFFNKNKPSTTLLNKFGLSLPPPSDLGPDRRADLLPVLILVPSDNDDNDNDSNDNEHYALLLNRRTGYLIGDLEEQIQQQKAQPDYQPQNSSYRLGAFMIQPLWFGGTSPNPSSSSSSTTQSTKKSMGIEMIHLCKNVNHSTKITSDGIYYGGDPTQAQEAMQKTNDNISEFQLQQSPMTGFDFKFFVQSTKWLPKQLKKEIFDDNIWFVADVSKDILFKSRDRLGSRRAKPLWTEIMELLGGEYKEMCDELYNDI